MNHLKSNNRETFWFLIASSKSDMPWLFGIYKTRQEARQDLEHCFDGKIYKSTLPFLKGVDISC